MSQAANVGETAEGFTPMGIEEARAVADAVTGLDRDTLLAERAEAEAQLRAAEATLGVPPAAPNGATASEQEPDEASQKTQDVNAPDGALTLDVVELRQAAAAARAADDELARAASEAERPPGDDDRPGTAEAAARALEVQEDLPAAWRRLVGALISATGMAIVIGALGWNIYWLLVPTALIAILTVDLRLSGKAARDVSAEAALELGDAGAGGPEALDRLRLDRATAEDAEARLAAARAAREAAYARFEELAPGRRPSEVDEIIADHQAALAAVAAAESEAAARRAAADAGRLLAESLRQDEPEEQEAPPPSAVPALVETPEVDAEPEAKAAPEAEPLPAPAEISVAVSEDEPAAATEISVADSEGEPAPEPAAAAVTAPDVSVGGPATATEWWFGSTEAPAPPVAASAPVRALAERLSAEGREALARIEAQLAALERADHARKSIEWHETNGSAEPS